MPETVNYGNGFPVYVFSSLSRLILNLAYACKKGRRQTNVFLTKHKTVKSRNNRREKSLNLDLIKLDDGRTELVAGKSRRLRLSA